MKKILETPRLFFREMTMADETDFAEIILDDETMYAWNGGLTEEDNRNGIRKQLNSYEEYGFGRWAVILKEMNKVIGMCGPMWWPTDREFVIELGYLFNKRYWHHGYASEAAIACRDYCFDSLGIKELSSIMRDTNLASMNVAIRCGMMVKRRFIKDYKNEQQAHYIFSVSNGVNYI